MSKPDKVVVWVPFRGDNGGWRDRNFNAIIPFIRSLEYEVLVGDSGHEAWSIANTWNHLSDQSGDWGKAILWGADLWVPAKQIHAAVASDHPGVTYAFDELIKLNAKGTSRFHAGWRDKFIKGEHLRKKQWGKPLPRIGGPRVVPRPLWEAVNGFDSRFIGWGAEDQDFAQRADKVHPYERVPGLCYDLWHPSAPRDKREANQRIMKANLRGDNIRGHRE